MQRPESNRLMQRLTWLRIPGEQNDLSNESSVTPVGAQITAGLTSLAGDLKEEWSLGPKAPVRIPTGCLGSCHAGVFKIMPVALSELSKNNETTIELLK